MSSSRLPGKVLADLGGEPVLSLLLRRLWRAKSLAMGGIIVATSTDAVDDPIVQLAESLGGRCVRGSSNDVLSRFLIAIEGHDGPIVRITADCPLIDPAIVDATVHLYQAFGCAYATNRRAVPDGLDVEVVAADALRQVASDNLTPTDREHVTSIIRAQPDRFPQVSTIHSARLRRLFWAIDDQDDLDRMRALVERLGDRRYSAGLNEILQHTR